MKKLLRRAILGLAGFGILLAVFHRVENWRGARAWKAWKAEQSARGVPFAWAEILPPPVPDAENFAAVPMIREAVLGTAKPAPFQGLSQAAPSKDDSGWREGRAVDLAEVAAQLKTQDLAAWLQPWEATLDAAAEAARRPKSRLLVDYTKGDLPALLGFRALAKTFRLRALARLHGGNAEGALQDVLACLRISRHLSQEPILLAQLLRVAVTEAAFQPLWEGVCGRKWDDRQLAELQAELHAVDLLAGYRLAWQGERIGMQLAMEKPLVLSRKQLAQELFAITGEGGTKGALIGPAVFLFLPKGWLNQNRVTMDRLYLQNMVASVDPAAHRILNLKPDPDPSVIVQRSRRPYSFIAAIALPSMGGQLIRFGRTQTSADLAQVAIALERHRLGTGGHPPTLDDLAPAYLKAAPRDLITGEALRYRPATDGTYLLYATGWNGTDEGGAFVPTPATGNRPATEGDWPWPVVMR